MTTVDLSRVYRAMLRKQQTLLDTLPWSYYTSTPRGHTFSQPTGPYTSQNLLKQGPYRVPSLLEKTPPVLHRNLAMESAELVRSDPGPGNSKELWYQGGVALGCE